MIAATQVRVGMVIIYEGELCKVMGIDHITQGNKRGKVQVEMRNLRTGNKLQYRFRSEDTVEKASLIEKEMEFLYNDGDNYYFMDSANYEQIAINKDEVGNAIHYLTPNTKVTILTHDEKPIGVSLPNTMTLKIVETEPPMKGATAAGGAKPAKLDNGLTIKVPQFIEEGTLVRVNTETNEYVDRA
jgi:elongation factor P